jgi:hypothetical protein
MVLPRTRDAQRGFRAVGGRPQPIQPHRGQARQHAKLAPLCLAIGDRAANEDLGPRGADRVQGLLRSAYDGRKR